MYCWLAGFPRTWWDEGRLNTCNYTALCSSNCDGCGNNVSKKESITLCVRTSSLSWPISWSLIHANFLQNKKNIKILKQNQRRYKWYQIHLIYFVAKNSLYCPGISPTLRIFYFESSFWRFINNKHSLSHTNSFYFYKTK